MDFYKKIKLTLLFTFGLFLFWFNCVYADELDITNKYSYNNTTTYLYMDTVVMDYIRSVPEYSGIGTDYYMVGIINTSNSQFEFYFTPYSFGTPSQMYLSQRRFLLVGNFSYIKYSTSTINFNPDTAEWNRSTGTNSGNTTIYTYRREETGSTYLYYWGSSLATWFADWNGFIDNFPLPFVAPTIDASSPDYVDGNINVFRVYSGSVTPDEPMTFKILDGNNDITFATTLGDGGWTGSYQDIGSYAGQYMYTITYRFLEPNPINIVTGNTYTLELTYPTSNGSQSTSYSWTFNLSADTTENIQDNTQQDIKNTLEETQSFLTDPNVDYDTIVGNFEESRVDFNFTGTNYLTTFFQFLNNIFVTDNYQDFVFTIPNSNGQSITIPADYMETHIPSAIIGLIRIFYWYMISRYIVKDVFGIIDRLRAGKVTDIDNNDIKADML